MQLESSSYPYTLMCGGDWLPEIVEAENYILSVYHGALEEVVQATVLSNWFNVSELQCL